MKFFNNFSDYISIFLLTLQNKSICRIYQIINFNKFIMIGNTIEFGVKNFSESFFKKKILNDKLYFSDQFNSSSSNYIRIDLQKSNKIGKKFSNVVIFNVLEHVIDFDKAIHEIKKILKKKRKSILINAIFI